MIVHQMTMAEYLEKNPFQYSEDILAEQKKHYEEFVSKGKGGFGTYNQDFTEIIRIVKEGE